MDILLVDGSYGHYKIILKEISIKGKGYIIIDSIIDLPKAIIEAKDIILSYNPKEVYLNLPDGTIYDGEIAFLMQRYFLPYTRFRLDKDFKVIPLELSNRYFFSQMITLANYDGDNYFSYTDADILYEMKNKNLGYIQFKKQFIGGFIYQDTELLAFFLANDFQHQGLSQRALRKLVNKIDSDIYTWVPSTNVSFIKLLEKTKFIKLEELKIWYKLS